MEPKRERFAPGGIPDTHAGRIARPGRVGIGRADQSRQAALPALSAKPGQPADYAYPGTAQRQTRAINKGNEADLPHLGETSLSIGQTCRPKC